MTAALLANAPAARKQKGVYNGNADAATGVPSQRKVFVDLDGAETIMFRQSFFVSSNFNWKQLGNYKGRIPARTAWLGKIEGKTSKQ